MDIICDLNRSHWCVKQAMDEENWTQGIWIIF